MHATLNRVFRVIWCKVRLAWVAVSEVNCGCGKVQSSTRRAHRETASAVLANAENAHAGALTNTLAVWAGDHMRLVPLVQHLPLGTRRWLAQHLQRVARALNTPRTLLASAIASGGGVMAAPPAPNQLPTGGQLSAGQASIGQSGASMVINQSTDRATINWNTFNVGSNAQVQFNQPSATSATFNRVLSSDPSQIFGRITANGQVILSNPAGVYFGASARVDVGGLVATTMGTSDADFMAGKNRYERNGSTGSVVNEGELKAALGGYIALLAPEVRNQGAVIAHMGTVALASGEAVDLKFDSHNRLTSLRVDPSQIAALVDNQHAVQAPGGLVIISAQSMDRLVGGVVKNSGSVEATGLQMQDGGRIVLSGSTLVQNSGTLDASNATGQGGSVSLQGERIELQDGSRIDAHGATGGGTVLVGGNWQGSADPLLNATGQNKQAATQVNMAEGASIDASATQNGDGGKVVLWTDIHNDAAVTRVNGTLHAKGGALGGNGGQVETSGHQLDLSDKVNVDAGALHAQGKAGLWLLDPYSYNIGLTQATSIAASLNTTNVSIDTNTSNTTWGSNPSSVGYIDIFGNISKTGTAVTTLTLNATDKIDISGNIGTTGGALNLVLNSGTDNGLVSGKLSLGGGSLTKSGAGTISLLNEGNSYTGGTTVSGGVLGVYANTAVGTGTLTLGAGTTLRLGRAVSEIANNINLTGAATVDFDTAFDYLLVGGGGGGSFRVGAGGGGGGVTTGNVSSTASTYLSITVGAGGAGGTSTSTTGAAAAGSSSSLTMGATTLEAGGGEGGQGSVGVGGASGTPQSSAGGNGGFAGGDKYYGGGGGGAGQSLSGTYTRDGGDGLYVALTGLTYGGGGGGGGVQYYYNGGTGGAGGGGSGSAGSTGTAGTDGLGGGGGGGGISGPGGTGRDGGAGGSGTVVIRYLGSTATQATGGTTTYNSKYTYQTFTSTGTSALDFNTAAKLSGTISGANNLTLNAAGGQIKLSGTNSYSGGTTISAGTVKVGDAGNTGTLGTGSVVNNGSLYLNRTDNFTFANAISGYGSLSKMQNSVATLTGSNSYSGSTIINGSGGTLQVGDGGTTGTLGTGSVINNGVLAFNRSDDLIISNNMSGTGALTKLGNNTLTLTGTLTYNGASTISGGTLVLKNNAYPTSKTYNGSGALRIEPSSASFTSAFSTSGWSFASTLSGLTLGKDGNTSAMTLANATSIAGPISIYGGDITLGANLTSTATAGTGVLLQGTKIKQNAGVDVSTGGSNISYSVLNSPWTSATEYGIQLAGTAAGSLATLNANGGNVSLSAGFATTGTSGGTDKAIELDFASIRTSGSGTISITGDASNNGNTTSTNAWGIGFNTVTANSTTLIQSENGAITLTGTAGKASSNARGMANDGTALRILSSSGAITLNDIQAAATTGSYLGLNLNPTSTAPIYIGADGSTVLSSSSNVTISADKATFAANNGNGTQINTSGTVTLQPYGNDFGSTLDTTNLALASTVSGLTIGKSATSADGTSDAAVTIGSATSIAGPVNVYGGNIAINAGLATTASLDSNAVITLKGSGNVTDGVSGYVQAGSQNTLGQRSGSLLLLGGNVTLDNSASNDVYNLAASGVSGLTYLDYGGLKIYTVGSTSGVSATGVVNIGTKLYSLAVDKDITTTNASANALTLNASMDSAVGADFLSNILINSNASYTPTISVGAGGVGRLYTGGITTNSQRVSQLSGLTAGHFRYNADETTNFATAGLTALGTGINAIYRQQPTATVTVANKSMTYGDALPILTGSVSGAVNGDSAKYSISNRLNSASGNIRFGSYTLTETGLTGLGYSVSATNGTLSVAKKTLTLTGLLAADKTYDRDATATISSYGTLSGLMGSGGFADAVTLVTSGVTAANRNFSDYNAGANKTVTVSGLNLTGNDAANYTIGNQTTTATINSKALTISGIAVAGGTKTYDGTTAATLNISGLSLGGLIAGDSSDVTLSGFTGTFDTKNVGTGKTVTLGYTKSANAAWNNYAVTEQTTTTANITKATLTLAGATGVSKTYDGTTGTSGLVLDGTSTAAAAIGNLGGVQGSDAVSVTGSAVFASADVARSGNPITGSVTTQAINQGTIALAGADAGNYNLSWTPGSGTIHPAPLTVYANNDAKFVSTADQTFSVSYAGFVAGQTASALATAASVTVDRTNALSVNGGGTRTLGANGAELAGVYTDALVPGGAEAKNYSFNYVKGSYAIVPADQLLVRMAPVTTVYGTAASYAVSSAKYFGQTGAATATVSTVGGAGEITGVQVTTAADKFVVGDEVNVTSATGTGARLRVDSITGNGSIATLSVVSAGSGYAASDVLNLQYSREVTVTPAVAGNTVTLTDMGGQTAQFNLAPTAAALSTAGKLKAGNYQFGVDGLVTESSPNFSNVVTVVGNQTVTPKALTASVTAGATKTYDGTRAMVGLTLGLTGIETGTNNDVVNASGTGTYDVDKNASTSKAYTVTGITLGGTDAGNYYLWDGTTATSTYTGTGAIGKRTVNVTYTGVDKVYDGNSTANVITSDDRVAGDKLTLAYQANFESMNSEAAKNVYRVAGVVTNKNIHIASASLTGSDDDDNYTVAATGTATAAKITPASLVISGIVGVDKTYNNTAVASLDTSAVVKAGLLNGDVVTLAATGAFADVNAELAKAVTITSTYTGADVGNYTITSQTGTTASIAKRQVMVTASNGVSKPYDGTTDMTGVTIGLGAVNGVTESGLVNGDSVDVSGTGSFSSASVSRDANGNVLSDKTYTLSDLQLSGTNAANYMIAGGATSVTGNNGRIDPKTLTLLGFDVASKVYDGTTAATIVSAGTLNGVVGADDVSASNTGATFSNKNVADGKTVTLNGIALSGLQAGNYSIAPTAIDTANITAKALTITANTVTKIYDGTLGTVGATGTVDTSALVSGDVVNSAGTQAFTNKNVGTGKTVQASGVTIQDASNADMTGNYAITYVDNNNSTITQLASATWVGGATGDWFNPVNWASTSNLSVTGVVPDLANVATVVIPTGHSVNFSAVGSGLAESSQPVSITALQGNGATLNVSAGALNVGSSGITLGGLAQTGGDIASAGSVSVGNSFSQSAGTLSTTGAGSHISLTQATGDLVWVSISSSGNLIVDSAGKTSLGTTTVDGNLTSTTRGAGTLGGVAQTGALSVAGTAQFIAHTGTGQDALLNHGSNNFQGTVSFTNANSGSWRDVTLVDMNNLTLGDITASGNLNATAATDLTVNGTVNVQSLDLTATSGDITQGANGTLTVTQGPTNLQAGDDITLGSANDFNGAVNVIGANDVVLNDTNSLTLGDINASGKFDVTAGTDIAINGTVNVQSLELQATTGDITQGANGTLTVTQGPTNLQAGDDITLSGANDFNGAVNVIGANDVVLNDTNSLTLGDINASGKLDVTAGTDIAINGTVNVQSLELQATTGDITQGANGTLTVTQGPTNLQAGDDITLGGANDFNGAVNVIGANDVTLNDTNSLTLGDITANGKLDATAAIDLIIDGAINVQSLDLTATSGDITQGTNGTLTVTQGPSNLQAGDDITLSGSNDFNGAVNVIGANDVVLNDTNNLTLGDITASGKLDATAATDLTLDGTVNVQRLDLQATSGDITQGTNGTLTVTQGPSNLQAGDDITLSGANDFNGAVNVIGANDVVLNDTNSLTLGDITANGKLDTTAATDLTLDGTVNVQRLDLQATSGNITQGANSTLTVTQGPSNLNASGDIILAQANDFNGTVNVFGNNVTLSDSNSLSLGNVSSAGNLSLRSNGELNLGTGMVAGTLLARSSNGNITQSGAVQIGGTATLDAGSGEIALNNLGNSFPKGVTVQASKYSIAGDARKAAADAAASVQGSLPNSAPPGSAAASAASPQPLVMSSGSTASGSGSNSTAGAGATNANSAGVSVDLHNVGQQNTPLMVAVSLPKGASTVGTGFSFELPETIKSMASTSTDMQISQISGAPLPAWLKFDQQAMRFEANAVPDSALPMQLVVSVAGQRVTVVISERTE